MEQITSVHNPKIKNIVALREKSRERRKQQLFVIEGMREINLAIDGDYLIHSLFICTQINPDYSHLTAKITEITKIYDITRTVFDKIAYRENKDGLVALAHSKSLKIDELNITDNPFIIIIEGVEKPGNLGAILRTADAAQVDAVFVCDPLSDVYNPNVVRSSIGCLFTCQLAVCTSQQAMEYLRKKGINIYAAELTASHWYHQTDFRKPSAIIMGTEADGLSDYWLQNADARIKIPMSGKIDSLNVSVSTAILTFEAMRQRGFQASKL